jgi:hypothetical protein
MGWIRVAGTRLALRRVLPSRHTNYFRLWFDGTTVLAGTLGLLVRRRFTSIHAWGRSSPRFRPPNRRGRFVIRPDSPGIHAIGFAAIAF